MSDCGCSERKESVRGSGGGRVRQWQLRIQRAVAVAAA